MSKLLSIAFLLCLTIPFQQTAKADEVSDAQKEKDVRRFLEVSGAGGLGKQMLTAMLGQMSKAYPNVPADFWTQMAKEADTQGLLDLIVPIYEKHFSDDEIRELIKFYESPVGKKLTKEQPLMVQESMQAGQQWGMALARKITERMAEKGYTKN